MNTLRQLTALAVLSLCCTSLTLGTAQCHPDGPENCTILEQDYPSNSRTVCSWSLGSNFDFVDDPKERFQWFVRLKPENEEGKLTSRIACSTGGESHCLWFLYKLEPQDVAYLSVSIQYEGTDAAELPLWNTSRSNGWDYGGVQINTDRNFIVVFKASTPSNINSTVFVDQISYVNSDHCVSHTAAPQFTTEPSPAQTTTTIPTTAEQTATTKEATSETKTDALSSPPTNYSTKISRKSTISPTPQYDGVQSEKSSDTVVAILSVIIAILIVVIIVMAVLLVVIRGKHLQFLKACCTEKQPMEQFRMNASHNAAYSLDADDSSQTNGVSNDPSNASSTMYNLCNGDAMPCQKTAGAESQNLPPRAAKQERGGQINSSTPVSTVSEHYTLAQPQNSNSVYHILEKESGTDSNSVHYGPNAGATATAPGEDGEYNRLDFDAKSYDEEKSQRSTGGVYSHLNEVDEDTYNEVHREKKAEVLDGVYSHIK